MRLTCPNCGAEYDIPDGMLPADGRHVQCSACHTRWYVRGTAPAATSEEAILTRLEHWRPRPVAVPAPGPRADRGPAVAAAPAPRPHAAEPLRVVPTPVAEPEAAPEVAAGPDPVAASAAPLAPPRREPPTKPADHPTVARPSPVPDLPARPSPRLDLEIAAPGRAPQPPPESRFLRGFLLVPVVALLALGAYRFGPEIAARVPAAEPALDAYAGTLDGWREEIERRIAGLRPGGEG